MKKDSKLCNFRLSLAGVECLSRLSDQWACSLTEAVERALVIAEAAVIAAPETAGVETQAGTEAPPAAKVSGRAESVAQRKAREAKEHAEKLAEADVTARLTGRDDIEYDLENVPRQSILNINNLSAPKTKVHYDVQPREAEPLTRPHGGTEAKRRRDQSKGDT